MSIQKCNSCANMVSTKAKKCPHCNSLVDKKEFSKIEHYGLEEENYDSTNMKYEYLVKSFTDEESGDTDPIILERLINACARQG